MISYAMSYPILEVQEDGISLIWPEILGGEERPS